MLKRQHIIYLTFMNYSILSLQLLPAGLATARKDFWLSFLLSVGLGLCIAWLIWRFDRKHPDTTLIEALPRATVVRVGILLTLSLYTLLLAVLTTMQLSEFISIGFLQETPFWVISLAFVVGVTYALRKGLMSIANLAAILTISTVISGTAMSIAISGNRHLVNLLPIGEYGLNPILLGMLYCAPIWVELFFIPVLPRRSIGAKGWFLTYVLVVIVNAVVIVGHIVSPVSTYGVEQALNLKLPLLASVKVISLGYINRFDVYGLALMIFGSYVRVSLYLALTWIQLQPLLPVARRVSSWYFIVPAGAVLTAASVLLFHNSVFYGLLAGQWFVMVSLGMLVWFLALYLFLARQPINSQKLPLKRWT